MIMCVILCFLYVFSFPLGRIPLVDSSWVAFILLLFMVIDKKYLNSLKKLFQKTFLYKIWLVILAICLYASVNTLLIGANDYSFLSTLIHQAISAFFGLFVVAYITSKNKNILECIIISFFIQSCIQIISMYFPAFRDLTNIFRPSNAIKIGQWSYTGIRGLAISGSAFFGLAIGYGLVFIIWAFHSKQLFMNLQLVYKAIMLVVMAFGGISAGRTSAIGLFIAGICYVTKNKRHIRLTSKTILSIFSMMAIGALIVTYMITKGFFQTSQFALIRNYANELFRTGSTTSGDELFNEMYFKIGLDTLVRGDGYYTASTGGYYMNTDAGYMRVILYIGIPGLILLYILQKVYLFKKDRSSKRNSLVLMVFILIMQIKGEALGFAILLEAVLTMYYFYCLEAHEKKTKMQEIYCC